MSIQSRKDLKGLRKAGRVVAKVLDAMREEAQPGRTTGELDAVAARILEDHRARSAPQMVYGFPGAILISVNDEAVHGVPAVRRLMAGDLVKFDVTIELDSYVADAAITVALDPVSPQASRLCNGTEQALRSALQVARAGRPISDIGRAVQGEAIRHGLTVLRELSGHGVGRTIHEPPVVPNYPTPLGDALLTEGLVIAIEPVLSAGSSRVVQDPDGWTLRTSDGSWAAHFEHSIVITRDEPLILTAA
jgi:methionyl aminopeptidase